MARYRLKRKTYGVIADAAKNTLGGVTEGAGKALDSKIGGLIGAGVGSSLLGTAMSSGGALAGSTIASSLGGLAGPVGYIGGAILGHAVTRGLGKGLRYAGQDMQTA